MTLKSYPPGVPEEVDINAYSSVTDVFEQAVERFGDKPCFSNLGTSLTYKEMDRYTDQLASYLQSLPGLEKGDRVAIMMPNVLQNPIAIFATLRAGYTVVNTNPLYTPRELEHQLSDSGARAIIVMENFCHTLEEVIGETPIQHVITTQLGDMLHWDGLEAVTPASKHLLDADTRFQKIVRIAIRVIRQVIQMLLKKHNHVHVIMADANHEFHRALEPRVERRDRWGLSYGPSHHYGRHG